MTIKTTAAEFVRFYTDPEFWPEGHWHDDEEITIGGKEASLGSLDWHDLKQLPPDTKIGISNGGVMDKDSNEIDTFEGYFRKWRKKQTTVSILVECDREKVDVVTAAIKAAGGRIVK